jgi:hypothetical protein
MEGPVVAVEWVGDMSAPSSLPNHVSSVSPEPHHVVDQSAEATLASSDEDTGTVKKTATPNKHAVKQKQIPVRQSRDLFSDDPFKRVPGLSGPRPSDISRSAPLRVEKTRARPRTRSLIRPRISTVTFQSPPEPHSRITVSSSVTAPSVNSSPPVQEARRWPQVHKAQKVASAFHTRRFSAPHASCSSFDNSEYSELEWFTPPSTRRNKEKAPPRRLSLKTSVTALPTPATRPISFHGTSPTALDTPTSLYSRSTSRMRGNAFARGERADIASRTRAEATPITAQRQVTIATQDFTSPFDSSASLSSRPNSMIFRKLSMNQTQARSVDHATSSARAIPALIDIGLGNASLRPDTPSSMYSRSTTGTVEKTSVKHNADKFAGSGKPAATPKPSSSSHDSLYSPPTPHMAQDVSTRNQDTRQRIPLVAAKARQHLFKLTAPSKRTDSPSSVYSRSTSGTVTDADPDKRYPEDNETPTEQSTTSTPPKAPRHRLSIHAPNTPLANEDTMTEPALSDLSQASMHRLSIHALGTPLSTSSPSSLYSRFRCLPRDFDGAPLDFVPLDVCPQMASSHARENDAGKPRTDCSFDAGVYVVEKKGGQVEVVALTRRGAVSEERSEMACLREDHKVLREEVAALREEFRALRDVLLRREF